MTAALLMWLAGNATIAPQMPSPLIDQPRTQVPLSARQIRLKDPNLARWDDSQLYTWHGER